MAKTPDPDGRRRDRATPPRAPRADQPNQQIATRAGRDTGGPGRLLERILETPQLARVVPRLQPEVLQRIIQSCGLEECAGLLSLATSAQLADVFDLDLWRTDQPGVDEQFDADRFGLWLEVMMEAGASGAADRLAGIDVNLLIAAFAQHVMVFDRAAITPLPGDGEEAPATRLEDGNGLDVGGYRVIGRSVDAWDAIVAVLIALDAEHSDCFHQVMRGCRRLSNSLPEVDGLDDLLADGEQAMFDLGFDRERRLEKRGYVTPAEARAFLQMSRQLRFGPDTAPPDSPLSRAYFRAMESATATDAASGAGRLPAASEEAAAPEDSIAATAGIVGILLDAGVLTRQPRGLLDGGPDQPPRLVSIQAHMEFVRERDSTTYARRTEELAYLANAIVAGCSIQGRTFTVQEGSDAAVATCNLGLENWPPHWIPAEARRRSSPARPEAGSPDDFLVHQDLIGVFQVGWTVLYERVCMTATERLIKVLTGLRWPDPETRHALADLRRHMKKHWQNGTPWRGRDELEVLALLDMPAWAALLGLIDECPVIHGVIGGKRGQRTLTVSASAFEFISENRQIASIGDFLERLPEALRP